jgi:2-oxo-4-hydroxy-4-carboxy-5-ureidoimidazoline decarboxylase
LAWAEQEQRGSAEASVSVLQALALGNQTYENRFGYIFIVCATGKTAEEMLSLLESRLPNDPALEIKIAAAEQAKITKLRLEKLIYE